MYLIAGLGNPGLQYNGTRHNVGFILLDHIARQNNLSFTESRWKALTVKTVLWGASVVLLKPETFMNNSGTAVASAAQFYKLSAGNIIVIHDDLDMEFGRVKIISGGGDGGHKGVRSCIEQLSTRDFIRIKIGIGRPSTPIPPEKYVLARFDSEEHEAMEKKMAAIIDAIKILLQQGISAAMTVANQKE
ncbi:aminoacyl-tRNA hydrolase [Thermodesulfobacteriota bacterium]